MAIQFARTNDPAKGHLPKTFRYPLRLLVGKCDSRDGWADNYSVNEFRVARREREGQKTGRLGGPKTLFLSFNVKRGG